jgi:glutamate carboxypeptidase
MIRWMRVAPVVLAALVSTWVSAQSSDTVLSRVRQEQQAYLDTLRDLVSIESGSSDVEGLATIAELLAGRLRALGGEVEFVEPPANMIRFENTPPKTGKSVVARFRGTGTKRVLLNAHMDTVYPRGRLA